MESYSEVLKNQYRTDKKSVRRWLIFDGAMALVLSGTVGAEFAGLLPTHNAGTIAFDAEFASFMLGVIGLSRASKRLSNTEYSLEVRGIDPQTIR